MRRARKGRVPRWRIARAVVVACVGVAGSWPASAAATFPGVNGTIAWQEEGPGGWSVASATPDGAFRRTLAAAGTSPSWSADGSLIAFGVQTPTAHLEIYTMAPDGSAAAQRTTLGSAAFPAWSPDGSKLAIGSFLGSWNIWRVDRNGTSPVQLTDNPGDDISPSWSPDGSKIAFQSTRDGDREIYVMNADGSNETNVSNNHGDEEDSPDWSPDGTKLLFTRTNLSLASNIVVMNADGTGATVIAPGRYGTWSPDGKRIAMRRSSTIGGATDVYTMNADGSGVTRVTRDGRGKVFLDWQPLHAGRVTQTIVASPDSIVFGEIAAFTSTVTSPGPPVTGLLQFRVNGENDGAPKALDSGGQAAHTPAFLLDVGDVVSATYSGDVALGWSTGDAPLTIVPASTTTTLVSSRDPVPRGEQTDLVVTVANTDTDITPFGSVRLSIDGTPIGPALDLDENGQAHVGLEADVPAGNYTLRVDYVDDTAAIADFRPSSASFVQRVTEPATTPTPMPTTPPPPPVVEPSPSVVHKNDLARFGALIAKGLRERGFAALRGRTPVFAAAASGTLSTQIYARRQSSTARAKQIHRTLIASARHAFASPSSSRLRLLLTAKGKRLIRQAKRLDIEIRTRFVPTSGATVSAVQRVSATRRGSTRARRTGPSHRGGSASRDRVVLRWTPPPAQGPREAAAAGG